MKSIIFLVLIFSACYAATILVGPTRAYTNPAAAMGAMTAGSTMILDDGTYTTPFDIPSTLVGFTIKSSSGNPYKCKLDGQGGVGSGHRLSLGKGIIHAQAPGLIQGIGFVNGGGGDGASDGEAGLYAENFPSAGGILKVVNCSFDGNENGIFVPGGLSGQPGQNVNLQVINSIFSKNVPNGVVPDGQCHNVYVNGASFLSQQNIWFPSKYGNNLKSRALVITVKDSFNRHDQGRCLDIPSGGQLTVQGGIYTVTGPTAVSNFMCYACENSASGIYTPSISGLTLVGGRANDRIWNNGAGIAMNFVGITQKWMNSGASYSVQGPGTVSGVTLAPPAGTQYVAAPVPVLPPWAL